MLKVFLTVIIILLIVIFLVQTPFVQDIIRGKAEKYLSRKLNTRVGIGKLRIQFPETILLSNIYVGDRQKDTLLSVGLIHVEMDMWALLHNRLDIHELQIAECTIAIRRQLPDTTFNYQFIVDAFSGSREKEPVAGKASKPMIISMQSILLDKIRVVYDDRVSGNDVEAWLGHSEVSMLRSDPSASSPLTLGQIDLEQSRLDYRNMASALYVNVQEGRLFAAIKEFNPDQSRITVSELRLDSTTTAVHMGKHGGSIPMARGAVAAMPAARSAGTDSSGGWQIFAGILRLNGDNFRYDDDNQPRQPRGMDYAHLKVDQLTLQANRMQYNNDSISGQITKGMLKEQSGFQLDQLKGDFLYAGNRAYLRDFELRTPGTLLQRTINLKYSSLAGMMSDPAHSLIDLDMPGNKIQVKDILNFVPSLRSQPLFAHAGEKGVWQINTRLQGSLADLRIATLQLSGLGDTKIDLSGRVQRLTDPKKIAANLDIRNISGSRAGLAALLPPGTLPSNISLPEKFDIQGKVNGGMDSVHTDIVLRTTSGTVMLKGILRQFKDIKRAGYDEDMQVKDLDLGYILQDTLDWGKVTAGFTAKGKGLDPGSADAVFSGQIKSAMIRRFEYNNFRFDGSISNQHAQFKSSIQDTAIRFTMEASADLATKFPGVRLDWQIDTLDLHALHLVHDTLTFKGHLIADFAGTNPDSLQGRLTVSHIVVVNGGQRLATDSILLLADRKDGSEDIRVTSEMADMDWKGKYKLTELSQALRHTIGQYYHFAGVDTSGGGRDTTFAAQDWAMQLHLRASPLVLAYMPDLKGTDSIGATLIFNSDRNELNLDLRAPRVQFGSQVLQKLSITAATKQDRLNYAVLMANGVGSGFELHQTSLQGYLAHDHAFTSLLLKDGKGKDRYRIAGQLDRLKEGVRFILNPDSLLLNYDAWQVSRDNFFQYDSAGIVIHDLKISNKNESLVIGSTTSSPASPIDISFTNFQISTLSRFAEQDSLLLDGSLSGKAQVKNVLSNPVFTSDLLFKGLMYKRDSLGDLSLKVNNEKANAFSADISLEGNKNDIKVKGEYYTGESRFDMKLDLGALNLASFRRVAEAGIQDMKGYLKGNLAITGTLDKPLVNGNLHFDSALITPAVSGEPLKVSNDNIGFDADGFNFSEFSLMDSAGNKATIDGNVYTKDYRNYSFDISLNAANFRLVNVEAASNRQLYGKMNLDAAINLTGDIGSPKVDGDLRINKKTDFFFVLPGTDPEVVDRQGVLRFADRKHPADTLANNSALALKARQSDIKGMDINLTIQTDSNAVFTMVIDERTGDQLTARGRSNLVFGMEKSGKMDLTGSYEVESGAYNLSLDLLKRKFAIQRGSTITWTGDPTTATLDLTANYTANSPSIDLIANEIAGRPQTDINKFKQKLPFLVTLKMEGELLKPKITFDITLPTDILTIYPDVDAKLQQIRNEESELNKQVFALLLLNRFVGEDPLQSAAGGGISVSNIAFQSASQILTNQMDQLAASLIKGVDIHFDLNNEQDYSTGNEIDYTEANVSVSKKLFNERIQVEVGSNFDVMGTGAPNQNSSNIAGDAAVDYKLTKDGRYMVRAYRKNQYEAVVEGQVVETGVSFILTFDYDKLKEIFARTQDDKLQQRNVSKPVAVPSASQPATPVNPPATPTNKTGPPSNQ